MCLLRENRLKRHCTTHLITLPGSEQHSRHPWNFPLVEPIGGAISEGTRVRRADFRSAECPESSVERSERDGERFLKRDCIPRPPESASLLLLLSPPLCRAREEGGGKGWGGRRGDAGKRGGSSLRTWGEAGGSPLICQGFSPCT